MEIEREFTKEQYRISHEGKDYLLEVVTYDTNDDKEFEVTDVYGNAVDSSEKDEIVEEFQENFIGIKVG